MNNLRRLRGRMGRSVDPVSRIVVDTDMDAAAARDVQVVEIVGLNPMLAELTDGTTVEVNAGLVNAGMPVAVGDVVLILSFGRWWILVDKVEVF